MEFEQMEIAGVWKANSKLHTDQRGTFSEWFKGDEIQTFIGREFRVEQANFSVSERNVIRGIHYSNAIAGQGKWITCLNGSLWDVIVDIRQNSPTFKKWIGIELSSTSGDSIFIPEGLGHAFMALKDQTIAAYLLTSNYMPDQEFSINPFDVDININWPGKDFILTEKDRLAPTLQEQLDNGKLG